MTAHELARKLLDLPDGEAMLFWDANEGYTPIAEEVTRQQSGEVWLFVTHEQPWKTIKE